jgi:hypothetical protein
VDHNITNTWAVNRNGYPEPWLLVLWVKYFIFLLTSRDSQISICFPIRTMYEIGTLPITPTAAPDHLHRYILTTIYRGPACLCVLFSILQILLLVSSAASSIRASSEWIRAKCLSQIQPSAPVASSALRASHSSPFVPITSNIWGRQY